MSLLVQVHDEILGRLGRVSVAARQAVESLLSGQHRSLARGLSLEFAGHRPYQAGDDLRHLDWKVWARTDRLDIKVFEEETRLRATLVVDASGSMGYGNKCEFSRRLAAALAVLMVGQGDAVGLAICDTAVRRHVPPGSTMPHLIRMLEELETMAPGGETSLAGVLEGLAGQLGRRGLVIILSDGFEDPERLGRALALLHHRRQDVRLYQIVDPDEEAFAFSGSYDFIGMEHSEGHLLLDADRVRRAYQDALAAHRTQLAAACHTAHAQFLACRSDEDLALLLVRALMRRAGAGSGGTRS